MMVGTRVVRVVLAAAMLWSSSGEAASMAAVKLCGRQLSEIMTRVCHAYNSPSWDVPTVEQPGAVARRKRQLGIADECCVIGCTWDQLSEYCSISAYSESPLEDLEAHIIADRSAEAGTGTGTSTSAGSSADATSEGSAARARGRRREVGRARTRGYGRAGPRPRCWCRRRRAGRRRPSLMGNMEFVKSGRAAPVVGTVSPLITWGRTLNTDLPTAPADRDRYAYVVYT